MISNLYKKYNEKKYVLNNITLNIPYGIYGFLGENGSGKTTLLKILATVQKFDFFNNLTVYEVLQYFYEIKYLDKENKDNTINEMLEYINLKNKINTKFKNLSGGQKQRIGIAQAIMGNPKIIILDEPTVGLDPSERIRFRNILNTIAKEKIILLSTHIISDISMICDNLAILKNGKILYQDDKNQLINQLKGKIYYTTIDNSKNIDETKYGRIISLEKIKNETAIKFIPQNIEIKKEYTMISPTLEEAYFYKINESGD